MKQSRADRVAPTFPVLVRHFFAGFFDQESTTHESLSPPNDGAGLAQILGLLAAPSMFFVLLFRPFGIGGWQMESVRYCFLSFSMLVLGMVVVIQWNALVPNRRDYLILSPLPLPSWKIFLAKTGALGLLLGVFVVVANFFGILLWPGIDGGPDSFSIIATHALVLLAGGLFTALACASLHGALMMFTRGALYRRASIVLQTALMTLLIMLFLLTPYFMFFLRDMLHSGVLEIRAYPGFWFLGLYERLRPATNDSALLAMGGRAVQALWIAALAFLLMFLPGYRIHAQRVIEEPQNHPGGPGLLSRGFAAVANRLVLTRPGERAAFHFITQTVARSAKHRLFLAAYGGLGAAAMVGMFVDGASGWRQLSLVLSFVLISGLRAAFNVPSELAANWAFQLSGSDSVHDADSATRKWVLLCTVPLLLAIMPAEIALFGPAIGLFHIAWAFVLGVLLIDIFFLNFQKVPFTCSRWPGRNNFLGLVALYAFGFTMYGKLLAMLGARLLQVPALLIAFFGLVAAAHLVLGRLRRHLMREAGALQYEGGEPEIRTLGLESM